jgi:hypothetical protein
MTRQTTRWLVGEAARQRIYGHTRGVVPRHDVVAAPRHGLVGVVNALSPIALDCVALNLDTGALVGAPGTLRDLQRRVVRVTSTASWSAGPLHAAIALRVARATAEVPDSSMDEATHAFCRAAGFSNCHRRDVGRELDRVMASPAAASVMRQLGALQLLLPLTRYCFPHLRVDGGDEAALTADAGALIDTLEGWFIRSAALSPPRAASLRYAAWLTSASRLTAAVGSDDDLGRYGRITERHAVSLTQAPERGFRAAVIAVGFRRALTSVLARDQSIEQAAGDCIDTFGPLKGSCAAALLVADIARRQPSTDFAAVRAVVVGALTAGAKGTPGSPLAQHASARSSYA